MACDPAWARMPCNENTAPAYIAKLHQVLLKRALEIICSDIKPCKISRMCDVVHIRPQFLRTEFWGGKKLIIWSGWLRRAFHSRSMDRQTRALTVDRNELHRVRVPRGTHSASRPRMKPV